MGLPPAQGHNNLRLTNTANLYQNHNFRLDKTQFNTINQHHKRHMPLPMPMSQHEKYSHPMLSSKRLPSIQMPTPILKPSQYKPSRSKNVGHHVQFELSRSSSAQRQTPYLYQYPKRKTSSMSNDRYQTINANKFPLHIPQLGLLPTKDQRSSRQRHRKHSIVSNMPLINVNSSVVMVNHSPFGLHDPRFGIFHHCSQSISYF